MTRPGGWMMGGLRLLRRPEVQKELKLTAKQKQALEKAMASFRPQPGQNRRPEEFRALAQKADATVKKTLTGKQQKRLEELSLQRQGAMALGRPDIAKKIGLTTTQTDKISKIQRSAFEKARRNQQGGQRSMDRSAFEGAKKQTLAVLTPAQKKKWSAMLGKPFKFEETRRR